LASAALNDKKVAPEFDVPAAALVFKAIKPQDNSFLMRSIPSHQE
jgi:hypothetical protein